MPVHVSNAKMAGIREAKKTLGEMLEAVASSVIERLPIFSFTTRCPHREFPTQVDGPLSLDKDYRRSTCKKVFRLALNEE